MSVSTLRYDLRGKTAEQAASWVKEQGLGSGEVADMTTYYKFHKPDTDPVVCVWLDDTKAGQCTFVLWDGRERVVEPGKDLHLYDPSGAAEWGMVTTINIMR